MAYKCQLCGKGTQHGYNVSHSKRRTKRLFKPNLHRVRVMVAGQMKRIYLCTKCLRQTKVKPEPVKQETKEVKTEEPPRLAKPTKPKVSKEPAAIAAVSYQYPKVEKS